MTKANPKLGVFSLTMITAAFIMAIRNFSTMATTGMEVIFFCLVAALGFLIPVSLISAELASGWPEKGGVYVWIKEAFGEKWGFLGISLQWLENVIWLPTALSFLGSTLAFIFFPDLANNKVYLLTMILLIYWGTTFLNLLGIQVSAWISTLCVIVGIFLPAALIISLALVYLGQGLPVHLDFSLTRENMIPNLSSFNNLSILGGFIFAFSGIEASAVHAKDVQRPQRNYPIAIFLAGALLVVLNIVGSLSIAIAVPQKDISLVAGIMDTFRVFLKDFHLNWAVPVMAFLVVIGALGQVSTWLIGPCRGLLATAEHGDLPPFFQKVSRRGMPARILFLQGTIVTLLSLLFVFMPYVNSSYWILLALATILYLVMYLLLFLAAIRLRYTHPHVPRAYKIPVGKVGIWLVGSIGFLCSLFTIILCFFPPSQLATSGSLFYHLFLFFGSLALIGACLLVFFFRKPHWVNSKEVSS